MVGNCCWLRFLAFFLHHLKFPLFNLTSSPQETTELCLRSRIEPHETQCSLGHFINTYQNSWRLFSLMSSLPSKSRSRSPHGPVCVVARYRNRRSQKEKKPSPPASEARNGTVLDKAGQTPESRKSSTSLEARFAALQPPPRNGTVA